MANLEEFWDSPQSVARYAAAPFLFKGEELALPASRSKGLRGAHVLDLACGAGRTTCFLYQMGAHVVGVDISQNLIAAARKNFPGIDFRVGDATALEFDDDSFDLVLVSFNSLDCLYPKQARLQCLKEIRRVLRPQGALVFSHHNLAALIFGWYRSMRPSKLAYRLRHILSGEAFRAECFLPEMEIPGMSTYYAWPHHVIEDLRSVGFETLHTFPNDPVLDYAQRRFHVEWLTRLADPWPYYVCRRVS